MEQIIKNKIAEEEAKMQLRNFATKNPEMALAEVCEQLEIQHFEVGGVLE